MTLFLNWLHMGGYAAYVWSAYALVACVLISVVHYVRSAFNQAILREH